MHRTLRFCARQFWFTILIVFLLQITSNPPASAQIDDPTEDPGASPADTTLPEMTYKPPVDADKIEDFVPPGVELISYDVAKDASSAYPLLADKGNAFAFSNDHIAVIMEAETVPQGSLLEFKETPSPLLTNESDEVLKPDPAYSLQFQVEILDQGKTDQVQKLERMSRLVVDMRHFGIDLDVAGGSFYLAYEDENEPDVWVEVPIEVYGSQGLISADVPHFSNWQSGWRPEAWALEWRPPTVNEFTGAATYQYPINIPAGRAGLQPSLGLSYNSASLRGAIRKVSYGSVATGWALSDISITRSGITNGPDYWLFPDTFRLAFNGTGGRLVKGATTNGVTTFYVEDMPNIQVLNYGGRTWDVESTGNTYWIVKDGNGVTYRLGYTDDSISFQDARSNNGDTKRELIAWHVDTVTDAFGNQINYSYIRPTRHENWGFWCPWGGNCFWDVWTYTGQVTDIRYNFNDRITALPAAHNVQRLQETTAVAASHIQFVYGGTDQRLSEIKVFHGSGTLPIRKYLIAGENQYVNNPPFCDELQPNGTNTTLQTWTRVINSITEQGYTPQNGGQWVSLPPTTFTYISKYHFDHYGAACFQYRYMSAYENGYGGKVEFAYASDGRQGGIYANCVGGGTSCQLGEYPSLGFNYRVSTVTTRDGRTDPVVASYSYTGVCYDQKLLYEPGSLCTQPDTTADRGNIGGYREVTVTTSSNLTTLQIQKTWFHQDMEKYGRPEQINLMDGTGKLLQQTKNAYYPDSYSPYNVRFTYTTQTTNEQFNNGSTPSISTKVVYEYEKANQGGTQYGNLTHIKEYDDINAATYYRETRRSYYPHTANWIVSLVGEEGVYDGAGNLLKGSWSHYDYNNSSSSTPPTQGRLTRQSQVIPISCGSLTTGQGGV